MSDKRFELTKINPTVNLSDTVYFIIDYENPNKEIRTLKDCVDLLNTLHQENQQLKHYKLYEDNKRLQTIIADLKEENERLEQKIKDKNEYQRVLEAKIRRLKDRIKVLEKNE